MELVRSISLGFIYLLIIVISLYTQGAFESKSKKTNMEIPDVPELSEEQQLPVKDKTVDISHAKRIIMNKDHIKPEVIKKINITQL